jgi:hypothetical protein
LAVSCTIGVGEVRLIDDIPTGPDSSLEQDKSRSLLGVPATVEGREDPCSPAFAGKLQYSILVHTGFKLENYFHCCQFAGIFVWEVKKEQIFQMLRGLRPLQLDSSNMERGFLSPSVEG